jgi:hypothetical protein
MAGDGETRTVSKLAKIFAVSTGHVDELELLVAPLAGDAEAAVLLERVSAW